MSFGVPLVPRTHQQNNCSQHFPVVLPARPWCSESGPSSMAAAFSRPTEKVECLSLAGQQGSAARQRGAAALFAAGLQRRPGGVRGRGGGGPRRLRGRQQRRHLPAAQHAGEAATSSGLLLCLTSLWQPGMDILQWLCCAVRCMGTSSVEASCRGSVLDLCLCRRTALCTSCRRPCGSGQRSF